MASPDASTPGRAARAGERGFTILETVIAMIVMMTVGLGASALFLYSISNNSAATARSQALAIAQQEMERLRSVDFDDPLLATAAPAAAPPESAYTMAAPPSADVSAARPDPTPTPDTSDHGNYSAPGTRGSYWFSITKTVNTVAAFDVPVAAGGTRPTVKVITVTVTPVIDNAKWAAAAVTITTTRSTYERGPY